MRNWVNKITMTFLFVYVLILFWACKQKAPDGPNISGLVPNQETAVKIAEAILFPIYGKVIYEEEPFVATLTADGNWLILGETHGRHGGGELMVVVQPKDGKVFFAGRDPGK